MDVFIFVIVVFVICVGGGKLLGKLAGNVLVGNIKERPTYIDKSVHHHHHHHTHEHKTVTIIDDVTKKKIFELKDKN